VSIGYALVTLRHTTAAVPIYKPLQLRRLLLLLLLCLDADSAISQLAAIATRSILPALLIMRLFQRHIRAAHHFFGFTFCVRVCVPG